eukprot:TRINITY_DN14219_c0_g1_i11.p1 TRINITY_DN14219_c0_g1~~TRINITY_DN14219_c0_g1_i11.p1  ORF type:complete len:149 (-),score=19.81 TRINITY_DN14219_c0_g1_i11:344-745(-)
MCIRDSIFVVHEEIEKEANQGKRIRAISKGLSRKRAAIVKKRIQRNKLNTGITIVNLTNISQILSAEDTSPCTVSDDSKIAKEELKESGEMKRKTNCRREIVEMNPYSELDEFINLLIGPGTPLETKRNLIMK